MDTVRQATGSDLPARPETSLRALLSVQMLQLHPSVVAFIRSLEDIDEDTQERLIGVLEAHTRDLDFSVRHLMHVILRMTRAGNTGI